MSDTAHSLSRRGFLRMTAASAGAIGAGALGCEDKPPLGPESPTTLRPLRIPSTIGANGVTLNTEVGSADLGAGSSSVVWGYRADSAETVSFPGPTIEARRGGRATITLTNSGLSEPTITHWHGMVIDGLSDDQPGNDGHPANAIQPGESFSYDSPIRQRAGMNWYHPHPHRRTGWQINMGLAGAFLIRDAEEDALGLPSGDREMPLILRDTELDDGNISYEPVSHGFQGDVGLVNGVRSPTLEVDRDVYRFRVLNGSSARIYRLALEGKSFLLIGNDGGLLPTGVPLTEVDIAPAERLDLLVDFSELDEGGGLVLRDSLAGWELLGFTGSGRGAGGTMPSVRSQITPLSPADVVETREFIFEGSSQINGREFEMDRVDFQVPRGQTERWILSAPSDAPHPVHAHASPFQIQSRTGGRGQVFPWETGWKDTVLLENGETVELLVRFDLTGINHQTRATYLMHCHKLEHEDAGMMLNFQVVG